MPAPNSVHYCFTQWWGEREVNLYQFSDFTIFVYCNNKSKENWGIAKMSANIIKKSTEFYAKGWHFFNSQGRI